MIELLYNHIKHSAHVYSRTDHARSERLKKALKTPIRGIVIHKAALIKLLHAKDRYEVTKIIDSLDAIMTGKGYYIGQEVKHKITSTSKYGHLCKIVDMTQTYVVVHHGGIDHQVGYNDIDANTSEFLIK